MPKVTLYIPDLFYPSLQSSQDNRESLDSMECLLARAHKLERGVSSYYQTLCHLLNFDSTEDQDIPVAAVSRLVDAEERPEGCWMRADPVHLRADRDALVLFPLPPGSLTQHDALALAAEVREVIQIQGWEVEVPISDRWYIRSAPEPDVRTTELDQVIGRDIQGYLPAGNRATEWHRLLTEIQMQLHASEVNRVREQKGLLTVNSLWFWGMGELPDVFDRSWSAIYAEDVFLTGLCQLTSTPCFAVPDNLNKIMSELNGDDQVLVVMRARDLHTEHSPLSSLENNWFAPLRQQLSAGNIEHLTILTEQLELTLSKFELRKFWRRRKPYTHYLSLFNQASS